MQAVNLRRLPSLPLPCRRALDGELYFYGRVLGFQPALPADFDPIEIVNAAA